jgi:hypothetical protein
MLLLASCRVVGREQKFESWLFGKLPREYKAEDERKVGMYTIFLGLLRIFS